MYRFVALFLSVLALSAATAARAQLRGHGGPVRAIAISADGRTAVSGSFDTAVIRWSLERNAAIDVLRFHDGAVNAVALLKDGRIATAGADARIAIWKVGGTRPESVLEGHQAPVAALALSPDGTMLASASWDRTARLWPLAGGAPRVLEGHAQNVNGVAFTPDGRAVVSAGYDATARIWPLAGGAPVIVTLPTPLNAVAVAPDGDILTGGADGKVHVISPAGEIKGDIEAGPAPIIALALSPDGRLVAAAGIRGSVAIIDRARQKVERTLVGPGLPVWSVAFFPDGHALLTGGTDRMIRRWDATTGEPIGSVVMGSAWGSAGGLCRRSRRRGVPRLRRLPHAQRRRREPRRPDARRAVRPPHRDPARLQFLRRAQAARHRLDAADRLGAVRDRPGRLYARHQDAGATHRFSKRARGAG